MASEILDTKSIDEDQVVSIRHSFQGASNGIKYLYCPSKYNWTSPLFFFSFPSLQVPTGTLLLWIRKRLAYRKKSVFQFARSPTLQKDTLYVMTPVPPQLQKAYFMMFADCPSTSERYFICSWTVLLPERYGGVWWTVLQLQKDTFVRGSYSMSSKLPKDTFICSWTVHRRFRKWYLNESSSLTEVTVFLINYYKDIR